MAGQGLVKRAIFGSSAKKRLSDITNLQSQPKSLKQDDCLLSISSSEKDFIDQLVKENRNLIELVADRNKIIELTGAELQKLRINMQKMRLQNWNLAQSNSQILAELNITRDRIKALQHEVACKEALLKAKNMDIEENKKSSCQNAGSQEEKEAAALPQANSHSKPSSCNRRRPTRSRSMGPSTTQQVAAKEKAENKRRCVRRQSARFESQHRELSENFFEIEDVKLEAPQQLTNTVTEVAPTQSGPDRHCAQKSEATESKRSSIGRPLRRAAEKVQSYKELPLKTKMRRSE